MRVPGSFHSLEEASLLGRHNWSNHTSGSLLWADERGWPGVRDEAQPGSPFAKPTAYSWFMLELGWDSRSSCFHIRKGKEERSDHVGVGKRRVPRLLRIVIFLFFSTVDDLNQKKASYILWFSYLVHKCIELMPRFQDVFLSFFFVICKTLILSYEFMFILLFGAPLSLCSPYVYCSSSY